MRAPSSSSSGRGMHSVKNSVPPTCAPWIVTLTTPVGAAGSRQSVLGLPTKPPYITVALPSASTRPSADALPGPHDVLPSSPHAASDATAATHTPIVASLCMRTA